MLGWEFPPLINGGLGVACHGLAHALAEKIPLTLLLPLNQSPPGFASLSLPENPSTHPFSPTLPVPTDLTPYLDAAPSKQTTLYGPDLAAQVLDFTRRAADAAARHSFDLIHAHDWMTALAGLEIRARTGKPLIFHVHSLTYDRAGLQDRGWIYEIEKSVLREADLVVAVSRYTRKIAIENYAADPLKTVVVHNGTPLLRAYRSPKPFPEKLVLFLGRLTSQKGPDHFLEIARLVLAENDQVRFAVAGTGEQLRSLMSTARRFGIERALHFTGFLNRKKVRHLLSMADAYCMPSNSEPFGLSALEAAQFGLPVVLSQESGVAEVLPQARAAPATDPAALAQHLLDALAQDRPKIPQQFRSWQDAATELLKHYRTLADDQKSQA